MNKKHLRKRIICKNKTKKVKHWWYNWFCLLCNPTNFYNDLKAESLDCWLKLDGIWYHITLVKEDSTIVPYVNGVKEV